MRFKSQYFPDTKALLEEKTRLWEEDDTRRRREEMVRGFYNGKDLKTENEAARDDTGLVNHLIGFRNLQKLVDGTFAIYSTTKSLLEITVDTGSPEVDIATGERISGAINKAIYFSGRFESVWSSVCGELCLTGRAPLVFGKYGWCPRLSPNLLLPTASSAVAEEISYGFAPHELNYAALMRLKNSVKGDESKFVDLPTVNLLLEVIKDQVQGKGLQSASEGRENWNPLANNIHEEKRTVIKAWKYYEVSWNEKKKKMVVSELLVTDRINILKDNFKGEEIKVVSYRPVAYNTPEEWLHAMVVDSQIGGVKTFGTARGIAELTYPSDTDSEELMSELIAGEKLRARPKFTLGPQHNRQQVNDWNVERDSIIPHDVTPAQMSGASNLAGPLALLNQNTSALTGGSFSNMGRENGELRQQALERQSSNASMQNNRMSAVYTAFDRLAREMVRRFLVGDSPEGTDGYEDIAWVRGCLKRYGLDAATIRKLGEVEHGRFKNIEVRVTRNIGGGDRESEMAIAKSLMENIGQFEPEVRPLIRRKWLTLLTHDPSLAEQLSALPNLVINSQRTVAENEFDTIERRAVLAEVLPVSPEDVDEDHVPSHLKCTQAFLAQSAYRQFTELDLMVIAAMVDHITAHLQRMASVPASAGAGKVFQGQLQQLMNAAQEVIAQVQDQQQQAQTTGMSPKEQLDFLLKKGQLELAAQKEGRANAEFVANEKQRQDRDNRAKDQDHLRNRQQYANETQAEKKHRLEVERLALEKEKVKNDKNKPKPKAAKAS